MTNLDHKLEPEKASQTVALYVEGMDCGEKAKLLEKKLKSLSGV